RDGNRSVPVHFAGNARWSSLGSAILSRACIPQFLLHRGRARLRQAHHQSHSELPMFLFFHSSFVAPTRLPGFRDEHYCRPEMAAAGVDQSGGELGRRNRRRIPIRFPSAISSRSDPFTPLVTTFFAFGL